MFESLEAIMKLEKEINCPEGKVQQCFPVLAAWIADDDENEMLHGLKRLSYKLRCECESYPRQANILLQTLQHPPIVAKSQK
jgi:hypothetical protein